MEYYGVVAAAVGLFVVALVSVLAMGKAVKDEWGLNRSRANWFAMALWTLIALVSLTGGIAVAWVADGLTGPSPSW